MKVLYDVGVFGQSKVHTSSRTGIFRTVYEVGQHLAVHPAITELNLFAANPELETLTQWFLDDEKQQRLNPALQTLGRAWLLPGQV
jgi:hypothetical protein